MMKCPRVAALATALLITAATESAAQHPGEVRGVVTDAATGAGLDLVTVSLPGLQRTAVTDAAGRFVMRGIEPGGWALEFDRLGYVAHEAAVAVRNGEASNLAIRLEPEPLSLPEITVESSRQGTAGEIYLDRAALERSGARTVGDAVRDVPGVVLQSSGPGAPQHVSLRGMAPDAVLVLVDGVPINDPMTGEADLSTIDAAQVASITVQPGARSARWGPRAAGGVIRIQTRRGGASERRFAFGAGSLAARDLALSWGGGGRPSWSAGGSLRRQNGDFTFALPVEVGGGGRRRENADVRTAAINAAFGFDGAGGAIEARVGYDALDRGLPGRGFAPSRHARQGSDRLQSSVLWRREDAHESVSAALAGAWQRVSSRDPDPPFGSPYADTMRSLMLELRLDGARRLAQGLTLGGGLELRDQRIAATSFSDDAPDAQLDAGAFAHASLPISRLRSTLVVVTVRARLDRDPDGGVVPSHALTLGWAPGNLAFHIAHRSSYAPPTPGDRFFRDAVGIEPNPDLAAERVPGEIEVGAQIAMGLGGWPLAMRMTAYRGDVDGMILWAPDYRFVWSPYNQDARRAGAELTAELTSPDRGFRLAAGWTAAQITYDRGAGDDDVQVAYRPRYTGTIAGSVDFGRTRFDARARYTGRRTTAPSRVNTLPAFWTLDAAVVHEQPIARWAVTFELHIDRVLDNEDTLIFGFPEPGRLARFGVRVAPGVSRIQPITGVH